VDELIQVFEPRVRVLIIEIVTHCQHDVVLEPFSASRIIVICTVR
jgi:hypothetical protein